MSYTFRESAVSYISANDTEQTGALKKSDRLTTFKKEKNVDFYSDLDYYIKIELFIEMRNCLLKLIRFFLNYILEKY